MQSTRSGRPGLRHPRALAAAALAVLLGASACGTDPTLRAQKVSAEWAAKRADADERLRRIDERLAKLAGGEEAPHEAAAEPVEWSYDLKAPNGPDVWGGLSKDFLACAEGTQQSPIMLAADTSKKTALSGIEMQSGPRPATGVFDGHFPRFVFSPGPKANIDGVDSELVAIEVHTPAEHRFGESAQDAELEYEFRGPDGKTTMVSVLVRGSATDEGPVTESLVMLPTSKTQRATVPDIDPFSWFPEEHLAFRYQGSRTSPPCTEGVTWIVYQKAVPVSRKVLERLHNATGDTARPARKATGRSIVVGDVEIEPLAAPAAAPGGTDTHGGGTPAEPPAASAPAHGGGEPAGGHGAEAPASAPAHEAPAPAPAAGGGHEGGHH